MADYSYTSVMSRVRMILVCVHALTVRGKETILTVFLITHEITFFRFASLSHAQLMIRQQAGRKSETAEPQRGCQPGGYSSPTCLFV